MDPKTPMKTRSRQAVYKSSNRQKDANDAVEKEALGVYCRVRPVSQSTELGLEVIDDQTVRLSSLTTNRGCDYKFTRVFGPDSDQKTVFDSVALPIVADALKGKSGLLFTYGVTGSGKTFTMTGTPDDIGILPRCIDVIFNSIRQAHAMQNIITYEGNNNFAVHSMSDAFERKQNALYPKIAKTPGGFRRMQAEDGEEECRVRDTTFLENIEPNNYIAVFASYVENHETKLFDLLDDRYKDPIKRTFVDKKICDLPTSEHCYVKDLTEIEVRSAQEALDVLNAGQKKRTTAATSLNSESSRGHAVFTLKFVHTPRGNVDRAQADPNCYSVSQLSMVDLAGSERLARTGNAGRLRNEANCINKSLMDLRNCLDIMRENQRSSSSKQTPVPFRNSKITQLFKGFFTGRSRVRVIVCVNPSIHDLDENAQVLKFAEASQDIVITRAEALDYRGDMFKQENVPVPAEDIAPAADFPIMVDLRFPLFASLGTRDFPAVFDMDPADMMLDTDASIWEELKEELRKRDKVHVVRSQTAEELLGAVTKKGEKLIKEIGGLRTQVKELSETNSELKNEKENLAHMLSSLQSEREQLRVNVGRQERAQSELLNQVKVKDAELQAERVRAEKVKQEVAKQADSKIKAKVAAFEAKAAVDLARREQAVKSAMKRLSKIRDLTTGVVDHSTSESDIVSACEEERYEHGRRAVDRELEEAVAAARTSRAVVAKPVARGNVPVVNPRHRRSFSEGNKQERWMDHQPKNVVPLGTVFQPSGLDRVRRKSATRLDKDAVAKCHKYSLTHQQEDSDGDLETHIYKGDIIPTAGGGIQCILNDRETLKQKSPTAGRKRNSPVAGGSGGHGRESSASAGSADAVGYGRTLRSSKYSKHMKM